MRILNFFNMLKASFGFHSHSHFGDCKFSCHVGFHLKEESNNTELACTFEHLLVYLHDASMLLPWTKMGTKWFVKCFFLKWRIAAPIWQLSILPFVHPCSPWGWCWQIWSSPQIHLLSINLKHLSRTNNKNLFAEDWMDRFHLVSGQKSGNSGTWGVGGGSEALSLCSWQAINSSQDMAWNKIK